MNHSARTSSGLKRLGWDAAIYGCSTLLVRGLQIFLIPVYSRALDSIDYGVVEVVAIMGALVNLTVALEISQGMARYIADAPDDRARREYASTAVGFATLAYAVFALTVTVFSDSLTNWLLAERAPPNTLMLAAVAIAVNGVFVIVQDLLRWQLRPWSYFAASLAYALGSIVIGIWLVAVQSFGVLGVFGGQLVGATIGLSVALGCSRGLLTWLFNGQRLRTMLRYSIPLVLSGAAVFSNLFIDRIVVREVLGLDALGIYGVTARFASIVSILAVGLQAALSPLVFRHWRDPGTAVVLAAICRWYLVAMVGLVGGISLMSAPIIGMITGPAFHAGSAVLPLLTLGAMLSTLHVFSPGLFLGGRTGSVAAIYVVGSFINLIFSLVLTQWIGLIGAAFSAVISPAFVFAGFLFLGSDFFKVPYQAARIAFSLLLAVILVVLGTVFQPDATSWTVAVFSGRVMICVVFLSLAIRFGTDEKDRQSLVRIIIGLRRG